MLYALINGDERLAKAHALYGAVDVGEKLPTRLFLEAYRACCDLRNGCVQACHSKALLPPRLILG